MCIRDRHGLLPQTKISLRIDRIDIGTGEAGYLRGRQDPRVEKLVDGRFLMGGDFRIGHRFPDQGEQYRRVGEDIRFLKRLGLCRNRINHRFLFSLFNHAAAYGRR